ncbi:TPA: hypothetical protein QB250_001262 [Pasteurella multocida]|nr:hypothetical protein [Pasteurella multocida]
MKFNKNFNCLKFSSFFNIFSFLKSSSFFNIFAAIILSLCGLFLSNYKQPSVEKREVIMYLINPNYWIWIGILLYVISAYIVHNENQNKNRKISELKKEKRELESSRERLNSTQEELNNLRIHFDQERRNKVKDWLKGLYKQIDLSTYDRISIYCVVEDKEFHLVNRYSSNPELSKSNTKSYILDKGVLYNAWCHKQHYDDQCPEFSEVNKEDYYSYISSRYNYVHDELKKMKMKSCRYFGLAIEDRNDNIGVILFESLKPDNLKEEIIDKIKEYCENYHDYLCGFIREYIVDINNEKNKKESLKDNDTDRDILENLRQEK